MNEWVTITVEWLRHHLEAQSSAVMICQAFTAQTGHLQAAPRHWCHGSDSLMEAGNW